MIIAYKIEYGQMTKSFSTRSKDQNCLERQDRVQLHPINFFGLGKGKRFLVWSDRVYFARESFLCFSLGLSLAFVRRGVNVGKKSCTEDFLLAYNKVKSRALA